MDALASVAFVFLAGLTLSGLSGTVIELVAGRRLALGEPFVSAANLSRSLVLVLLAGPFMTANEALAAVRERQIGWPAFAGVLAFCLFWIAATGVFIVGLVENARDPIG